jgi:hypothetical protein
VHRAHSSEQRDIVEWWIRQAAKSPFRTRNVTLDNKIMQLIIAKAWLWRGCDYHTQSTSLQFSCLS